MNIAKAKLSNIKSQDVISQANQLLFDSNLLIKTRNIKEHENDL